jgi:hypothetical protein
VSNPFDLASIKSRGIASNGVVSYPPKGSVRYSRAKIGSVNPEINPSLLKLKPGGNRPPLGIR